MGEDENVERQESASGEENVLLPTVTSAAKAVDRAGVTKSLLGPVSKVIGDRWGKSMQEWFDARDAKRAANLKVHQDKVKTIERIPSEQKSPTERQVAVLVEWAEQAQSVDPDSESDLAALWQSLLGDIYRNDPDSTEILNILKQLSRADAAALLRLSPHRSINRFGLDQPFLQRFHNFGIIGPLNTAASFQSLILSGAMASVLIMLGIVLPDFIDVLNNSNNFGESRPLTDSAMFRIAPTIMLVSGFSFLIAAALLYLRGLGRYQLTRLGEKMVMDAHKYMRRQSKSSDE